LLIDIRPIHPQQKLRTQYRGGDDAAGADPTEGRLEIKVDQKDATAAQPKYRWYLTKKRMNFIQIFLNSGYLAISLP